MASLVLFLLHGVMGWILFSVAAGQLAADGDMNNDTLIIPTFEGGDGAVIDSNSTRVALNISCDTLEVVVDFIFDEPFTGWALLENDPGTRGCSFHGNGSQGYRFRIPLRSCGTRRNGYDYSNSLMILYNQRQILEMGDQRKVILCQYPVPVAPLFLEVHRNQTMQMENDQATEGASSSNMAGKSSRILQDFYQQWWLPLLFMYITI